MRHWCRGLNLYLRDYDVDFIDDAMRSKEKTKKGNKTNGR